MDKIHQSSNKKVKNAAIKALNFLGLKCGSKEGEEVRELEKSVNETLAKREESLLLSNKIDNEFIRGKINLDEYLDMKRVLSSYETPITSKVNARIFDKLINKGVIIDGSKGPFIKEPFWLFSYQFLNSLYTPDDIIWLARPLKWATRTLFQGLGVCSPLDDRNSLIDAVSSHVGDQQSILFSKTPAICKR